MKWKLLAPSERFRTGAPPIRYGLKTVSPLIHRHFTLASPVHGALAVLVSPRWTATSRTSMAVRRSPWPSPAGQAWCAACWKQVPCHKGTAKHNGGTKENHRKNQVEPLTQSNLQVQDGERCTSVLLFGCDEDVYTSFGM